MSGSLIQRVDESLSQREAAGLLRRVQAVRSGDGCIDLSSNDYWRMSRRAEVRAAAIAAIERDGCSASASPLVGGFGPSHQALLEQACAWHGFSSGLLWSSGYAANSAVLSTLPQKGDLVLADRLIHHSMIAGILRSGARLMRYPHNDIDALERLLERHSDKGRQVFVVTESVFSMDGDYPDLAGIGRLKERFPFCWILDEAHALGWYGERGSGLAEHFNCIALVDVLVGTMGKALGSMGAYTLFRDDRLSAYLANFAGEFIYSTGLAPSAAATAAAAMRLFADHPEWRRQGQALSRSFRATVESMGLQTLPGDSPIVPIIIGGPEDTLRAAACLAVDGVLVGAIRNPTVPAQACRLRIGLRGDLSSYELDTIVSALRRMRELLCL